MVKDFSFISQLWEFTCECLKIYSKMRMRMRLCISGELQEKVVRVSCPYSALESLKYSRGHQVFCEQHCFCRG